MPQTFQVLRCYKCEVFQVHPTKRSKTWKCKLCDEKQSFKRFYGLGTGKECRLHVQKLNGIRGELDGTYGESDASDLGTVSESSEHSEKEETLSHSVAKKSKWLHYVDAEIEDKQKSVEEQVNADRIMHLNNTEVVLELPKKSQKKCFAITNKVADENETNNSHEKKSQSARLLTNDANTIIKKMDSNKSNVKTSNVNLANNVLAPNVVNQSKWGKFVEDTQNIQDGNEMKPITYTDHHHSIFPFLEDEDIDAVLDF